MNKKKFNYYYLLVFIFFIIIGFLIPYTGDDWNNLIGHNGNILSIFKNAIYSYNTFEGRFFSRIFDCIFIYYKPIWVLVNALGMTFLYFVIVEIVKPKRKLSFLILILESILLVDEETFSQVYVWLTGNITYFIPMIFLMFLLYLNRKIFDKNSKLKYNKALFVLLPILTFINSMFVENVTVGIISVCILVSIYDYIKNKKINVLMIICSVISIIGLYLMISSPGTIARSNTMPGFQNLSLIGKILKTFPRQMNYVFIKNSFLILLLLVIIFTIVKRNIIGIKKYVFYFLTIPIPLVTLIENLYYCIFKRGIRHIEFLLNCNNLIVFIYWLVFLAILIYLVIKYTKVDKFKISFFFIIALLNNASMLISPLAGGRTSYLSTIMLFICAFIVLDNLDIKLLYNDIFIKINRIICICLLFCFLIYYFMCYMLDFKREQYIYKQLSENKETIEVIMLPGVYIWNANAWGGWHLYTFKKYYNIPDDKRIIIKKIGECSL